MSEYEGSLTEPFEGRNFRERNQSAPLRRAENFEQFRAESNSGPGRPSESNEFTTRRDFCIKHPGHTPFIPVQDLTIDHLPPDAQTPQNLEAIRLWADRTVKVKVFFDSPNRPEGCNYPRSGCMCCGYKDVDTIKGLGSGFILDVKTKKFTGRPCCCFKCRMTTDPKGQFCEIKIVTARHLIYDNFEAMSTEFDCFYDSENAMNVKKLYGICDTPSPYLDTTVVTCTTHDEKLIAKLHKLVQVSDECLLSGEQWGAIISHPHGMSKKISFGMPYVPKAIENMKLDFLCRSVCDTVRYRLPRATFTTDRTPNPACQDEAVFILDGEEYKLPECTNWSFPQDFHGYFLFSDIIQDPWTTLPLGTRFEQADGKCLKMAPWVEFHVSDAILKYLHCFHDIATCPGSSGGPIILKDSNYQILSQTRPMFVHPNQCNILIGLHIGRRHEPDGFIDSNGNSHNHAGVGIMLYHYHNSGPKTFQ